MAWFAKLKQNGLPLSSSFILWKTTVPRIYFTLQVIIALSLAIFSSRLLGLDYPGWAALSSFAVMSTSLQGSLLRAGHRVLGTFLGGALALLLSPLLAHGNIFLIAFCALTGAFTVWHASVSSRSYAWILGTVTAVMVIAEAQKPNTLWSLFSFTQERVAEVAIGCALCVLITLLFTPLHNRLAKQPAQPASPKNRPAPLYRLELAFQAGVTLGLVTYLLLAFHLTGLWQATISILAILTLPSSTQAPRDQITSRMVQRFMGCLAATLLSLILLPLLHGSALLYILTLWAGLWLGCHLQQGERNVSYFGRQFTVAWIIVFVQDTLWLTEPELAVMRCISILMAIAVLVGVMLLSSRLLRRIS